MRYLGQDRLMILMAPVFSFLLGEHDENYHHKLRYMQRFLKRLIQDVGFEIGKILCFNGLLFLLAASVRLAGRFLLKQMDEMERMPSSFINLDLYTLFFNERFLLKRGGLPFGLSLLVIAKLPGVSLCLTFQVARRRKACPIKC